MRRLARHLFTISSALSLLLCVAACVLWVRSYWHVDLIGVEGGENIEHWQRGGNGSSGLGLINVEWWLRQNDASKMQPAPQWTINSWPAKSNPPSHSWHGFAYDAMRWNGIIATSDGQSVRPGLMTYRHLITLPHWFAVLMTMPLVALSIRRRAQRRRGKRDLQKKRCAACGYDLRASPERCPECGKALAAAA